MEKRYIKPDGSVVWVEMQIAPFRTPEGKYGDHVCIITDISKRKEIEETLKYNSEHDVLTGLYNRSVLGKMLEHDLKPHSEDRSAEKRALISINLSPIHALSLSYGFHYSQDLLRKISDALNSFLYVHGIGGGIGVVEIDGETIQDVDELLKKLLITSEMAIKINRKTSALCFTAPR
jgi:predicted signal transduction protein with EAL and GGDEF domain